jgi:hypothetical protein
LSPTRLRGVPAGDPIEADQIGLPVEIGVRDGRHDAVAEIEQIADLVLQAAVRAEDHLVHDDLGLAVVVDIPDPGPVVGDGSS